MCACVCVRSQFLESLTPPEWTQEQIEHKKQRRRDRMLARYHAKVRAWERDREMAEQETARREEEEKKKALKEGRMVRLSIAAPWWCSVVWLRSANVPLGYHMVWRGLAVPRGWSGHGP